MTEAMRAYLTRLSDDWKVVALSDMLAAAETEGLAEFCHVWHPAPNEVRVHARLTAAGRLALTN